MKRLIHFLVCLTVLIVAAYAIAAPPFWRDEVRLDINMSPQAARVGWYTFATDTAAATSWKVITTGSYAFLIRPDSARIISSSTADSTNLVLIGITASDSVRTREKLRVSGTDSVWSTKRWIHIEQAIADTESAGTITVVGKTSGPLAIVVPGQLKSYAAVHFFGKLDGGIMAWGVNPDTTTQMIDTQLRWYRDSADAGQSIETGYVVLDRIAWSKNQTGTNNNRQPYYKPFPYPIFIPAMGTVMAVASSGTNTTAQRVSAEIFGYDNK